MNIIESANLGGIADCAVQPIILCCERTRTVLDILTRQPGGPDCPNSCDQLRDGLSRIPSRTPSRLKLGAHWVPL